MANARRHSSRRWMIPALVAVAAVLVIAGLLIWQQNEDQQRMQVTAENPVNVGSGIRNITYQGKRYAYNNRITAILVAGLDNEGELKPLGRYTVAPRADSISLVVLDELHGKMTVVALSRDTMTPIRRYTLNGRDRGQFTDHLGYAYTYGDGWDVSCKNLCEAVSQLLYGVPITDYVVMNRSSLPMLANTLGPVTVTVPNDDLKDTELSLSKGQTTVIDATNLEAFVRSRDTQMDLSNVGRMERQQTYINAVMDTIRKKMEGEPSATWNLLQDAEATVHTNITHSRYLSLIKALKNTAYDSRDYYIPEGQQVVAEDHDEFYPDEGKLLQKVVEIFFVER